MRQEKGAAGSSNLRQNAGWQVPRSAARGL